MTTATYSEVRKNFKAFCDKANDDAPIVITRERGENVVLVSERDWESIEETLFVMGRAEMMEGLAASAADIRAGRVTEHESPESYRAAMMARA